jgi:hypothetical protein
VTDANTQVQFNKVSRWADWFRDAGYSVDMHSDTNEWAVWGDARIVGTITFDAGGVIWRGPDDVWSDVVGVKLRA